MKTALGKEETLIKGQSALAQGKHTPSDTTIRINYLIENVLKEIATNNAEWTTLYYDKSDGRYWESYYGEYNWRDTGPLSLRNISEAEAKKRYNLYLRSSSETSTNEAKVVTDIANTIPKTFARVMAGSEPPFMLGLPGRSDVYVTDATVLQGLNPSQISTLLDIQSRSSYVVIEFPSEGIDRIARPVNRLVLGFIGRKRNSGGAPEFIIPNGPVPSNSITKIIDE